MTFPLLYRSLIIVVDDDRDGERRVQRDSDDVDLHDAGDFGERGLIL